ncbi:general transcription factor IIH subunit 1 [Centruroides vittatus]|uniref:general transcription factor IIH subunit 1 n=1 Tax=Centruroides vittatus TaxID=120091 RepID=UPI0035106999
MGTSSEDVLLMVNHVRYNKNDGTLYLMAERIAWMLEGKDTFSVSLKYADIKMQKISPDGKSKVQLQVLLHTGSATTFHFTNPLGQEYQLKDRNEVKELLQQLLPKFKRKVNKELEEKNKILQEDPILFQLYRDLVMSQVITAEEFWSNHAAKRQSNNKEGNEQQEVGVSAAFLADIKPQTDGCNGLKYNITADIIESIFRTYPAVKKKHMENVPNKLSESEFWTRFFQSHYFHRDRLSLGTKDIFTECVKYDEQDIKNALKDGIQDPFVDVTNFEDTNLDDGYGVKTTDVVQSSINANLSMIRRFNHHSMMVLNSTCQNNQASLAMNSKSINNSKLNENEKDAKQTFNNSRDPTDLEQHRNIKKIRLEEKIQYEDLGKDQGNQSASLNLAKCDRYIHGPTLVTDSIYFTDEEIRQSTLYQCRLIANWNPSLSNVQLSQPATAALGELSPGGAIMKNSHHISIKDTISIEIQQELQQLYIALCELVRHFWQCFPTTTSQLEEKVIRMQSTLERFEVSKIQPFRERLLRERYNLGLTDHMINMLRAAYSKFATWQGKRISIIKK